MKLYTKWDTDSFETKYRRLYLNHLTIQLLAFMFTTVAILNFL